MLDLKFVCSNIGLVEENLRLRHSDSSALSELVGLAERRRRTIRESEALRAKRNRASDAASKPGASAADRAAIASTIRETKARIKELDAALRATVDRLTELMCELPNMLDPDVPEGRDSSDNPEIRRFLAPRRFDFPAKPHWELGRDGAEPWFDSARAAKIAGARFTVYRGWGAKLERAVMNYMLDTHSANGYVEVFPPFLVNRDAMFGTAQLPKFEFDMYAIKDSDLFLAPTAEVPVTNLHRGETLELERLPIRYCAYTACFRAEAGAAGKDTRGLIRQHQFNKVELVNFVRPEDSEQALEDLTAEAERILRGLEIPYRVVLLCSGDTGFGSCKTYDIEAWMPSYGRYVEISSCSNYRDFQARRAGIRFRDADGKPKFAHTLNGSGLAIGRTVAAVAENFQNADGTISVPTVLRKYLGADLIG